jgi:glycosyltransferase involved in cell wall biosynthesis
MDKIAQKAKFSLQCTKPVASDSPDHLQPHGTRWDNSRNPLFNGKLFALFAGQKISVLDFGCSGGGFVKSCIDAGHTAAGLEGSDYSKRTARAEWATIPDNLFTADITGDWQLFADSAPAKFNAITAWEFIEHIKPSDLPKVCAGALRHLMPGGIWIMSVSTDREVINGHVLHQTVENRQWWLDFFASQGLTHHEQFVTYFSQDWVRGPLQNAPGSFHLVLSRTGEKPPAIPSQFKHPLLDLVQTAGEFFNAGIATNCKGMIEYALLCFDQGLQEAPGHVEMRVARANMLLKLNRPTEAAAELQTVLKLSPRHPQASQLLAQLFALSQQNKRPAPVAVMPTVLPAAVANTAPVPAVRSANPKISVVTPTFNCGQYLRQCIESVLAQEYENFEHIIVDGASKDETVEILKSYPHLKWISEPDSGEAEALNKGLKLATGEIINWLNADDYYNGNDVFRTIIEQFQKQSDCDVLVGKALIINEDDNVLGLRTPKQPLNLASLMRWFKDIHLYQPAMFYTRTVADKVGPYRQDLYFSIDLEYWVRIAAAGFKYGYVDSALARARLVRAGAKSANDPIKQEKNWQEIVAPYAKLLPTGEQFNYWKDYFDYRIANQSRYNESISTPPETVAMRALATALIEKNQFQVAFDVVQQLLSQDAGGADGYWMASDLLCRMGRPAEARHIVQEGLRAQQKPDSIASTISFPKPSLPLEQVASRSAVVFFPHNPLPPQSGAHRYFLSILDGLRASGFRTMLVSSTQSSETSWTQNAIDWLNKEWSTDVVVHQPTPADMQYVAQSAAAPFGTRLTPPGMHTAFRQAFAHVNPELIVVNYAAYGSLAADPIFATARRTIVMHDLATINEAMQKRLWAGLGNKFAGQFSPSDVAENFLDEGYFARETPVDPAEMAVYNQYDFTVCISQREVNCVNNHAPDTRAIYLPADGNTRSNLANTYAGDPVFAAGANLFNVQGFLYFAGKVLPKIRAKYPAFNLRVVGNACKWLKPQRGTQLMGFVNDLIPLYVSAPFAICPLLGGTGQQVKIIEAMSLGVPVVCMKKVAESSPIEHGVNGLIATDAEEFAECVQRLYEDRQLCRWLGTAARETIRTQFTGAVLMNTISPMTSRKIQSSLRIAV